MATFTPPVGRFTSHNVTPLNSSTAASVKAVTTDERWPKLNANPVVEESFFAESTGWVLK
jgi:hypothetical protein